MESAKNPRISNDCAVLAGVLGGLARDPALN
jgi:hypothetical protein